MRLAVFADIHGNQEALEAFITDVSMRRIDRYMCLGDIVGYGANPNECIELVRSLPRANVILGNHDAAALWMTSPYSMTQDATEAILWTMEQLTPDNANFLKNLNPTIKMGNMLFSHANPYNPMAWRYVVDRKYAARTFSRTGEKLLFVGHSHEPLMITRNNFFKISFRTPGENAVADVDNAKRQIVNCGSVGQPRDRNPKASYLIYDTREDKFEFYRLAYNYRKTADKISAAGLPRFLSSRLSKGI